MKKKSLQSHQPSQRVMLWKLQFNSESVSERIDHFRRPSSYVFSTKSDEIKFYRYLHEQSYLLQKKSPQSHQPSWRVMLWKLQFNSESVSARIVRLRRPSSHVFSTESDEIKFYRYLHDQSYFLPKISSQSHQPSWRVMLWKALSVQVLDLYEI